MDARVRKVYSKGIDTWWNYAFITYEEEQRFETGTLEELANKVKDYLKKDTSNRVVFTGEIYVNDLGEYWTNLEKSEMNYLGMAITESWDKEN